MMDIGKRGMLRHSAISSFPPAIVCFKYLTREIIIMACRAVNALESGFSRIIEVALSVVLVRVLL